MLQVQLPVVDRIKPQSSKFAMGVWNEAAGVSKLNDSPDFLKKRRIVISISRFVWR